MAILKIKDAEGNVQEILAIKGNDGKDGTDGKDYVLTDADKQEIAELVAEIIKTDIPSAEGVSY
jgi:hypothetical protein